ncbi:hypothetical protein [Microbacterium sufflavum]
MSTTDDDEAESGPRVPIWLLIAACVLCAVGGAFVALALATANLANWGAWVRDFAKSPGAAASAALIAAVIAYRGLSSQVAVARRTLRHQQRAAQSSSWWEMFEWASGRAVPAEPGNIPLPDVVTISTLQRLAEDATTDVQRTACGGLIDMLTARMSTSTSTQQETEIPAAVAPAAAPAEETLTALASYVASSKGTRAASNVAEAYVYERSLTMALASASDASIRVFRNPVPDMGADAVIEVDGRRVLLVIKFPLHLENVRRSAFRQTISRLRSALGRGDPILLVSPIADALSSDFEQAFRTKAVQWRDESDTPALLDALRELAAQGTPPSATQGPSSD